MSRANCSNDQTKETEKDGETDEEIGGETAEEEAVVRRATSVRLASVGPERNPVAEGVIMVAKQDPTTGQERSGTTKAAKAYLPAHNSKKQTRPYHMCVREYTPRWCVTLLCTALSVSE